MSDAGMTLLIAANEKATRFADPTMAVAERSVTSGGGIIQIAISLLFVLAAIFVVGWVMRRTRVAPRSRDGHLKVLDEVALGHKERAVVLEADGTRLVLGVGEGRVALLHRYTPRETSTANLETTPPEANASIPPPSFLEILKKGLGK